MQVEQHLPKEAIVSLVLIRLHQVVVEEAVQTLVVNILLLLVVLAVVMVMMELIMVVLQINQAQAQLLFMETVVEM